MADAHLHVLDFLQNGDILENGKLVRGGPYVTPAVGQRGKRLDAVLWAMDRANVSHATVMGLPFLKKWSEDETFRSKYYLDSSSRVVSARDTDYHIALAVEDFVRACGDKAKEQLDRLFVCISGFNATDLGAVDMIVKRIKEFPGMWRCIGEAMSRHDDLTNLTTGERPRANHPALFRILDFAGKHNLPVFLHHNIAPVSPTNKPKLPLYLPEFVEICDEFPKTKIILAHAGMSRRVIVGDLTAHLDAVLAAHQSHLFVDLSWVVFEDYVLKDVGAWVRLIEKYPSNFMLGSDAVGSYDNYTKTMRRYDQLLEKLAPATAKNLARENFLRLMPKDGARLPPDYAYPETSYVVRPSPLVKPPVKPVEPRGVLPPVRD